MKKVNLKISIGAALISAGLCCVYCLSRWGFGNNFSDLIKVLGVSWFILLSPNNLFRVLRFFKKDKLNLLDKDECLFTLGAIFLIVFSGFFVVKGFHWQYIFVLSGYLFFGFSFYEVTKQTHRYNLIGLGGILLFILLVSAIVWEGRHLSPLYFEMLTAGEFSTEDFGNGLDTLFHLSIAQMIKTYGVPSIGLDQLVPIKYHFGSHFVLAQFSKSLNIHMLKTYQLAYPVIFISIFFKVFLLAVVGLRQHFNFESQKLGVFFWLTLLLCFFGFIPVTYRHFLMDRVGLGLDAIWISESYLLSLILFFSIISIAATSLRITVIKSNILYVEPNVIMLIILMLVIVAGFLKVSTMAILLAIGIYLLIRLHLFKNFKILFFSIAFLILCVFILSINNANSPSKTEYEFLYSYSKFIRADFSLFLVLYYFLFLVIVLSSLIFFKLYKAQNLVKAFRDKSFLLLEVLIVIALAGFLPGSFIKIEGGSAFYFSEIQYWFASCLILVFLPSISQFFYSKLSDVRVKILRNAIIAIFFFVVIYNTFIRFSLFVNRNVRTRVQIVNYKNGALPKFDKYVFVNRLMRLNYQNVKQKISIFSLPVKEDLEKLPLYPLLHSMAELDTTRNKKESIIFIKNYLFFFNNFPCYKYPFIVPALTGMSTLLGYDSATCHWVKNYGFEDYPNSERSFYKPSEDKLCEILQPPFRNILKYNLDTRTLDAIVCTKEKED